MTVPQLDRSLDKQGLGERLNAAHWAFVQRWLWKLEQDKASFAVAVAPRTPAWSQGSPPEYDWVEELQRAFDCS